MAKYVVAVTGANRGIGLAICKAFHDRGDIVYGVVRKTSSELTALGLKVRRAYVRRRSVLGGERRRLFV